MRRITMWLIATVAAVVLLFSYRTSTAGVGSGIKSLSAGQPPGIVAGPPASGASAAGSPPANGGGSTAAPKSNGGTVKVNGSVADTIWGPVQVQVTIAGARISDVNAVVYPSGTGRDYEINSYALPILRQQVLQAQSANIDGVSGATVTSDGYRQSLQSALDAAHFQG